MAECKEICSLALSAATQVKFLFFLGLIFVPDARVPLSGVFYVENESRSCAPTERRTAESGVGRIRSDATSNHDRVFLKFEN